MKAGEIVVVEGFDLETAECRLVAVEGDVARVCSEQEWEASQAEKREPDCLGWPLTSVRKQQGVTVP